MKIRKRSLGIIILMVMFYISYILWIQKYLTTDASINNIQTMIYWGQLFVWVTVWAGAIWIAIAQINISQEQIRLANRQLIISSIWNKVNWLTAEIAIWQSKLEHMVSIWRDAKDLTKEQMDEFMLWIEWIKKSLEDLYKSRNDTLDIYDKEILKK